MSVTIFYSWQSDLPNSVNRSFIEDALKKAIKELGRDDTIDPAIRDEPITVDKDTQGLPGSPAIVDAILKKISNCTVFVPDLTFVGKSEDGRRLLPNPNVLIEYGYALNALGNACILKIMNTHYGEATAETLPFDMRHLRWPLTYKLSPEAISAQRKTVKTQLVKDLKSALAPMLIDRIKEQAAPIEVYEPTPFTSDPSTFMEGNFLGIVTRYHPNDTQLFLPPGQRLFLRIIPQKSLNYTHTKEVREKIMGNIGPMGSRGPVNTYGRNSLGAFSWRGHWDPGKVLAMTQLFRSGEIWGIDAESILESELLERTSLETGYFPMADVERIFDTSMSQYLAFAQHILNLQLPLRFFAGAANIKGYRLASRLGLRGSAVEDNIFYQGGIIESYEISSSQILRPFFEYFWNECDETRPDVDLI